jgi:hypothetical protein
VRGAGRRENRADAYLDPSSSAALCSLATEGQGGTRPSPARPMPAATYRLACAWAVTGVLDSALHISTSIRSRAFGLVRLDMSETCAMIKLVITDGPEGLR